MFTRLLFNIPYSALDMLYLYPARTAVVTVEPVNERVDRINQHEKRLSKEAEEEVRKEREKRAKEGREKRRREWELEEGECDELREREDAEDLDDSGFEPGVSKNRRMRRGDDPEDDDGCVPCRVPRNLLQLTSPLATSLGLSIRQHDSFVRGVYEAMGLDSREMKGSLASAYRWRREGERDLAEEALRKAGDSIRERDARVTCFVMFYTTPVTGVCAF